MGQKQLIIELPTSSVCTLHNLPICQENKII